MLKGDKIWFYDEHDNCIREAIIKNITERIYEHDQWNEYTVEWVETWNEEVSPDVFTTQSHIRRTVKSERHIHDWDCYLTKEYCYDKTIKKLDGEVKNLESKIKHVKSKKFELLNRKTKCVS